MRHSWSNSFISDFRWDTHIKEAAYLATISSGNGVQAPLSLRFLPPQVLTQQDQLNVFEDLDGSGSEIEEESYGDESQLAETLNRVALDDSDSEDDSAPLDSLQQLKITPSHPVSLSNLLWNYF